jgi:hypothetical protein
MFPVFKEGDAEWNIWLKWLLNKQDLRVATTLKGSSDGVLWAL